ncbi:cytochrome (ubi)quinol oxidase subunit III [Alicyclobacillus tolerans]|nr:MULTISPECIES: cytochrome (ubi)quinol oxidase subunit III [Alicyclobacillus]QRF24770.1 cytochrome (ubi)quinol oxidase subunit III [Alicyclobacillus sp. TC]
MEGHLNLEHDHHIDTSKPMEYSTEDGSLRIFGFWVFLGSDLVLFSCLFTMYILLFRNTAGGFTSQQLYDYPTFLSETFLLLTSSFTCGLATYSMRRGWKNAVIGWLIVTVLLGLGFIGFEVSEFLKYVHMGATISKSAFLSSFFILVGTHGCHVSLGILWLTSIIIQVARRGLNPVTTRKIFISGLYWHFLDVAWIFIFTVVYFMGKVL